MKRPEYSRDSSLNPYPAASRSSSRYSASCDWETNDKRLGELSFEHPDGAPASPNSKIVLLSISGYAWVEGVWGRRGGSGCDPHGVGGGIPRTARGDGIVAATLSAVPRLCHRGSISPYPYERRQSEVALSTANPYPSPEVNRVAVLRHTISLYQH